MLSDVAVIVKNEKMRRKQMRKTAAGAKLLPTEIHQFESLTECHKKMENSCPCKIWTKFRDYFTNCRDTGLNH